MIVVPQTMTGQEYLCQSWVPIGERRRRYQVRISTWAAPGNLVRVYLRSLAGVPCGSPIFFQRSGLHLLRDVESANDRGLGPKPQGTQRNTGSPSGDRSTGNSRGDRPGRLGRPRGSLHRGSRWREGAAVERKRKKRQRTEGLAMSLTTPLSVRKLQAALHPQNEGIAQLSLLCSVRQGAPRRRDGIREMRL
jgi:hypothetical protein